MRAFVRISIVVALIGTTTWFWLGRPDSSPTALAQTATANQQAFLIRFGVNDAQPRDWSGEVRVENGRVVGLDPWQFSKGDELLSDTAWTCATTSENYWDAPWERSLEGTKRRTRLTAKGFLLRLEMAGPGKVNVQTVQGSFAFDPGELSWSRPKTFINGRVVVSLSPSPQKLTQGPAAEDYVHAIESSKGNRWVAYQTYENGGDRLWIRRDDDAPVPLTEPGRDLFRVQLAEDSQARIWAVWSEQRDSNWDLFARAFDGNNWVEETQITTAPGSDIFHSLARDGQGNLYLAWQGVRSGNSDIFLRTYHHGRWQPEVQVSNDPANDWEPQVAASKDGEVSIVWDTYSKGNYDVLMKQRRRGRLSDTIPIADSDSFEARASAHYDAGGRLWLAWDEGDADWGKDYVAGAQDAGMGLLQKRQVRVAAYSNGRLEQLPGNLPAAPPEETSAVFQAPRLTTDGNGNPWVFFRYRTHTPVIQGRYRFRSMWRLGATSFQKGAWTPLIRFPLGYGRIDMALSVGTDSGGDIQVHWAADGREFPDGFPREQDVFGAALAAGDPPDRALTFVDFKPSTDKSAKIHPNETAAVARLRSYRAEVGGKTYRPVRGDMHRHTDISWDGNRDGSLFDAYRYALDAAGHDFLGVADHQAGEEVEYGWWMIQKAVDLFTIPGTFTPLYGYERSRGYPSGHRNAMFAQRGVPVLKMLDEERERNSEVGVEHFYEDLRKNRGIVMSHTSATGAGTDWRDNDPDVETLVEIYQGYRRNYEHEGAPRSTDRGSRPAGFVWKAWEKGLKLGLQASSDHVSTHTSHGMIWVEDLNRENIIEAIRARRAYAATDNILVDFRVNGRLMGDAFESSERPRLEASIVGTGPVRKVEVIKNNTYIHTHKGGGPEVSFTFVDNDVREGESYYYIRVEQENGELAWASPVWVTYKK
ncbi:MAG TPA: hypothetical protein VML01_13735 [Bryobacterales bacterium]|nr:hypothetical protein [Bryobacterales bacterium]